MMRRFLLLMFLMIAGSSGYAEEKKEASQTTAAQEEKVSPELKRGRDRLAECRKLFDEGKQAEAVKLAIDSIDIFVAPHPPLKGIDIGTLETEKHRITVFVNTTEDERAKIKKFIVRPYTFYVFSKQPEETFLYNIDYEHGYSEDGKLQSAALGRYVKSSHLNYGMVDTKASFEQIRDIVVKLVESGVVTSTDK